MNIQRIHHQLTRNFIVWVSKPLKFVMYIYFPLANVKTRNAMNFSQSLIPYTKEGRERIYKQLQPDIQREISLIDEIEPPGTKCRIYG